MEIGIRFLEMLDMRMRTPHLYGWFHLLCLALTVVATVLLCRDYKRSGSPSRVRSVVFGVALLVTALEIYKQINFSFSYADHQISFDYQWYAFPWQFCSTPMYVGLLTGVFRKGRVHESLCAFLATYSIFAGAAVMLYPVTVFVDVVGINIQTMICHGSMVAVGIYLLYSGYVKLNHKTILKAIPVFLAALTSACIMNEIAYQSGLLQTEEFNMFFVSPYCTPSLPVYSQVQQILPFPVCLVIYAGAFTLVSYLILLIAMGIKKWYVIHVCVAQRANRMAVKMKTNYM